MNTTGLHSRVGESDTTRGPLYPNNKTTPVLFKIHIPDSPLYSPMAQMTVSDLPDIL